MARLRPQLLFFRSDPLHYFLRQIFSLESELADWAIWLAAELLRPICPPSPALWFQDKPPCPAFFMVLGVKLGPHDHMTSTCWLSCCPAPSFYFMPIIMLLQMMLGLQGKSAPPHPSHALAALPRLFLWVLTSCIAIAAVSVLLPVCCSVIKLHPATVL